jgi:hypothetical protein
MPRGSNRPFGGLAQRLLYQGIALLLIGADRDVVLFATPSKLILGV